MLSGNQLYLAPHSMFGGHHALVGKLMNQGICVFYRMSVEGVLYRLCGFCSVIPGQPLYSYNHIIGHFTGLLCNLITLLLNVLPNLLFKLFIFSFRNHNMAHQAGRPSYSHGFFGVGLFKITGPSNRNYNTKLTLGQNSNGLWHFKRPMKRWFPI